MFSDDSFRAFVVAEVRFEVEARNVVAGYSPDVMIRAWRIWGRRLVAGGACAPGGGHDATQRDGVQQRHLPARVLLARKKGEQIMPRLPFEIVPRTRHCGFE